MAGMIPVATIDMLEQTWRSLSTLGISLSEAQWKTPTALPGWTVQDNYSHIIATERMLQGLPGTEHRVDLPAYVRNPIGEFNEHEVDARRDQPGARVLAEFDELTGQRIRTLRGADEAYFTRETVTPTGPNTVTHFLQMRLMDSWMHEQDVRRALGQAMTLSDDAAAHTVDWMLQFVPMVVGKRAKAAEGESVTLNITGPVERTKWYTVVDGRATEIDAGMGEPSAAVAMDTETFLLLAMGRCRSNEVRYELIGDRDLGQRLVDNLCTMI